MAGVEQGPTLEEDGEGALRIDTDVFTALAERGSDRPRIVRWFDCWCAPGDG